MNKKQSHFDAWGHPTLDYFSMLDYYKQDNVSITVLRNNPPCKYAVIPHVEIHIDRNNPCFVRVYYIFPGGQREKEVELSDRAVSGLRRCFSGKVVGWKHEVKGNTVVLRKAGRVFPLRFSRFGIVDTH